VIASHKWPLPAASRPTSYASQTLARAQPVDVRQTCPHAASSSSTSVQGIKHSLLQCSIAPYMVRCTPLIGLYGGTRVRIDRNPANVTVGFSTIPLMVMRRQGNLIQLSYCRVKQIFTRGPPTRRRQFRRFARSSAQRKNQASSSNPVVARGVA
jgi:hypothetical protein